MSSVALEKREEMHEIDQRYSDQVAAFEIEDREYYEVGEAYLRSMNDEIKRRKDYFKPMKDRAKQVHQDWVDAEKQSLAKLNACVAILKAKMTSWVQEQQRLAEKREGELRAKAREQGVPEDAVVVASPDVGSTRTYYEYRVVDFAKLPDEYKIEDSKALGALARTSKGKAEVPGVEFKEVVRTVVGR